MIKQKTGVALRFENAYPRKKPREVVEKMVLETFLTHRITGPPFDPREVAHGLGVGIDERNGMGAEAVLSGWPDALQIVLDPLPPGEGRGARCRQRFSIAHELGHVLLRRALAAVDAKPFSNREDPFEERFCDRFAAELLMPKFIFGIELGAAGISPDVCIAMAERYQVSLTALLHRVNYFAGGRKRVAAVIRSTNEGGLKTIWSTASKSWSFQGAHAAPTSTSKRAYCVTEVTVENEHWFDGRTRRQWSCASIMLPLSQMLLTIGRQANCPLVFRPKPTVTSIRNGVRDDPQYEIQLRIET